MKSKIYNTRWGILLFASKFTLAILRLLPAKTMPLYLTSWYMVWLFSVNCLITVNALASFGTSALLAMILAPSIKLESMIYSFHAATSIPYCFISCLSSRCCSWSCVSISLLLFWYSTLMMTSWPFCYL